MSRHPQLHVIVAHAGNTQTAIRDKSCEIWKLRFDDEAAAGSKMPRDMLKA